MNKEGLLERRASARNKAALRFIGIHNVIVEGMVERTRPEHYFEPDHLQNAFDIARQGLFLARKFPICVVRAVHLGIDKTRFERTYAQLHPDTSPTTEELTEISWQIAPISDAVANRLAHVPDDFRNNPDYGPVSEL